MGNVREKSKVYKGNKNRIRVQRRNHGFFVAVALMNDEDHLQGVVIYEKEIFVCWKHNELINSTKILRIA